MNGWAIVLVGSVGCYALKLAGYALPQRWFDSPALRRVIGVLPIALLAGLIVVETIADGSRYDIDWPRLAGLGAGALALSRRAPFLVVVVGAAVTAAVLRAV